MTAKAIIKQAKQLIADERTDEARELLRKAGFSDALDPEIQEAYCRLIRINPELEQRLAGCLAELQSPDVKVRVQASRTIERAARLHFDRADTCQWLGDPRAVERIIAAFDDPEPKVVQNVVVAVTEICHRIYRDLRGHPVLVRALSSKLATTRVWACYGLSIVGDQRDFPLLLPLLYDKTATVRHAALKALDIREEGYSAANRELLKQPFLVTLKDKDPEVRTSVVVALSKNYDDDDEVLLILQKMRLKEKDGIVQYHLDDEIKKLLAKRATSRSVRPS